MTTSTPSRRQLLAGLGAGGLLSAGAGAAYAAGLPSALLDRAASAASMGSTTSVGASSTPAGGILDPAILHRVGIDLSAQAHQQLMTAYNADGSKDWVETAVTLDGTGHTSTGVRLKGNSTIFRVADGSPATAYPWLIRLDKFEEGRSIDGVSEVVVRTNNSTTSLNEAVALDLLHRVGLAGQQGAYAAVSIGDVGPALRLLVENPGEAWANRTLGADGLLYKAEASGNYTYRGTDASSYEDVFDQESGADDLTPLIEFLDFINNTDDSAFAAGIAERVDLDALATYRAFEALVDNYDAIDGPGNNSYLWWDRASARITVIGWDHNLTFGVSNRPGAGGNGGGAPRGGGGMARGGPGNRVANPLVTRTEKLPDWAERYAAATSAVQSILRDQGPSVSAQWADLLTAQATDLVQAQTIASERATIERYFA